MILPIFLKTLNFCRQNKNVIFVKTNNRVVQDISFTHRSRELFQKFIPSKKLIKKLIED